MSPLKKQSALTFALLIVAFCAATYEAGKYIAKERAESLTAMLTLQATEQKALLATIAETTARNGADSITESVVRDCNVNERDQFDTLLSSLDKGLSAADLKRLETLFGRCGSFFAERKAMMVARLEREVEVYGNYVAQLETISPSDDEPFQVDSWRALKDEEKKQSEYFNELVVLQEKIITELALGKTINSSEISSILSEVKQTQQDISVANKQSSELRLALTKF